MTGRGRRVCGRLSWRAAAGGAPTNKRLPPHRSHELLDHEPEAVSMGQAAWFAPHQTHVPKLCARVTGGELRAVR